MKKLFKLLVFILVLTFSAGNIVFAEETKYESIEGPDIDLDDGEDDDLTGGGILSPQIIVPLIIALAGFIGAVIAIIFKRRS